MARRREPSKNFWRLAIVGMVLSVFALFGFIAMTQAPPTEPSTACRQDRKDSAHTIVLIDQSDPFRRNDYSWVEELVDAEARSLPKFGRLTIMTPNVRQPFEPREAFSRCSPGAKANPLTQNPRMVEDNWRENFRDPLNSAVNRVLADKVASSSPLAEALYSIFDRADFQPSRPKRRVVIVSDMIQNSQTFNFYRTGAVYDQFAEKGKELMLGKVGKVNVVARIVPRDKYDLEMSDVKAFWDSYFAGTQVRFTTVN